MMRAVCGLLLCSAARGFLPSSSNLRYETCQNVVASSVAEYNHQLAQLTHHEDRKQLLREFEPNLQSYHILLDTVSEEDEAIDILETLQESFGYTGTLACNKALRVCGRTRAEQIFTGMQEKDIVDDITLSTYLGILGQSDPQQAERIADDYECNIQTWNTVVSSYVQQRDLKRAEGVVEKLQNMSCASPNTVTYSLLLDGYVKQHQLDRAHEILVSMRGSPTALPNLYTYATLIHGYARGARKYPEYAVRAQQLLEECDCRNTQLVTAVMDAWKHSKQPQSAENAQQLLDRLIDEYVETNNPELEPNAYCFSVAIAAWAKSRNFGRAIRARQILTRFQQLDRDGLVQQGPNTICYTAVLNACAYADDESALSIAILTYKELCQSQERPNHITYAMLLTAIRNLSPNSPQRVKAVLDIFQKAVVSGCVDVKVVRRLQSMVPPEQIKSVLPFDVKSDLRNEHIPTDWRRNVAASA